MEQMKLRTVIQLMEERCGEPIEESEIVKIPAKNMNSEDEFDTYVARNNSYFCAVLLYRNGSVHVHIH